MKKSVGLFLFFGLLFSIFPFVFAVSIDESVSVEFANQAGGCYKTANVSGWMNNDSQVTNWSVGADGSLGNCLVFDGTRYLTNYSCCPSGQSCQQHVGGNTLYLGGRCVPNIDFCFNIGFEGDCNLSDKSVAEKTLGVSEKFIQYLDGTATCFSYSSADCIWTRPNATSEFSCQASFINITGINDTVNGTCTQDPMVGNCVYVYAGQDDKCDEANPSVIVNYTAQFSAKYLNGTNVTNQTIQASLGAGCLDKSVVYACSASIQLPSFSAFNFLVSIFGIGVVYFLFRKNFKENI